MVFKFTLKELKNYKAGRGKLEIFGMTVVLKDNLPDERLFSITEAERLRKLIEYLESLEEKDPRIRVLGQDAFLLIGGWAHIFRSINCRMILERQCEV